MTSFLSVFVFKKINNKYLKKTHFSKKKKLKNSLTCESGASHDHTSFKLSDMIHTRVTQIAIIFLCQIFFFFLRKKKKEEERKRLTAR
jgi:hypothetical protein